MARPLRIEFEGAVYHLCARGNERQRLVRVKRPHLSLERHVLSARRRP